MGEVVPFRRKRNSVPNVTRRDDVGEQHPTTDSDDPHRQAWRIAEEIASKYRVTFSFPKKGPFDESYVAQQRMVWRCLQKIEQANPSSLPESIGRFQVEFDEPILRFRKSTFGCDFLDVPLNVSEAEVFEIINDRFLKRSK